MSKKLLSRLIIFVVLVMPLNQSMFGAQSNAEVKATKSSKKPWYKSVWAKAGGMLTTLAATAVTAYYVGKKSQEKEAGLYPKLSRNLEEGVALAESIFNMNTTEKELKDEIQDWIDQGHNINTDIIYYGNGMYLTPLMTAAWEENMTALKLLVETFNADINIPNKEGETALTAAAEHTDAIEYLLKHDAKVNVLNSQKVTPLIATALVSSDPRAIGLLLNKGAKVNVQSDHKYTPLNAVYLRFLGEIDERPQLYHMMQILLERGAEVNVSMPDRDGTLIENIQDSGDAELIALFNRYAN